jgi:transposase
MWCGLGILKEEWQLTPQAVQIVLACLPHQFHALKIRCAAYEQQLANMRQQAIQIDDLKAEVAELRERLSQNSRNSSLPPSSDQLSHQPKIEQRSTGRLRGAQPGHPGHGRRLKPRAEIDHVVELRPVSCAQCGQLLLGHDPHPERHQVSEVPPAKVEVTEYRRHTLCCLACGTKNQAQWPAEMPRGNFGPHAQAIISYLTGRLGTSHRDVAEVMEVLHGLRISPGSVSAMPRQVSQALARPIATAQQFVRQQQAQYVDETGWHESTQQKWLWVNATREVTVFKVLSGRSACDAHEVVSESAKGVVTTDRYGAYNWLSARRRQLCWAHLMRDFQAMVERSGDSAQVGQELLDQSKEMFRLWHKVRDGTFSRREFAVELQPIQQEVKKLLEAGSRSGHKKTGRTCQRIMKVEKSLWTFVRVEGVEPTNNAAERALRRAVLWRRKSFGTQSVTGSEFVEWILTAVTTLRQQGRDVMEYLTAACRSALLNEEVRGLTPGSS